MVSADAGVWLAFLRNEPSAGELRELLEGERVALHPFVLAEVQLRLRSPERKRILGDLDHLVACPIDPPEVVSAFIEEQGLARFDIDVVGAHLLASATRHGDQVWASSRGLRDAASDLKLAFVPRRG